MPVYYVLDDSLVAVRPEDLFAVSPYVFAEDGESATKIYRQRKHERCKPLPVSEEDDAEDSEEPTGFSPGIGDASSIAAPPSLPDGTMA